MEDKNPKSKKNMKTDSKLEEYLEAAPKNRHARRKLLKRQGWYYEIVYAH